MQKIKMYFNKTQIISDIIVAILIIIIPIIKDYRFVSLGWFFIAITFWGDAMFLKKWAIIGRTWNKKTDKNYKTQLSRKYSDITTLAVGIFAILLCPIVLLDSFFSKNYIAMIIAYIISNMVLVFLFIRTDKENKNIEKLIPKIRK